MFCEMNVGSVLVCSDQDLEMLCFIVFELCFMSDVGRISGDWVMCMGVWGWLCVFWGLFVFDWVDVVGICFWIEGMFLLLQVLFIGLVSCGNVVVFIVLYVYFDVDYLDLGILVVVVSSGGDYIYYCFVWDDDQFFEVFGWFGWLCFIGVWQISLCDLMQDICVVFFFCECGLFGIEFGCVVMVVVIGGGLLFGVMLLFSYLFGFFNDEKLLVRLLCVLKCEVLEVYYQFIVCLVSGCCVGVEVLVCWIDSSLGWVFLDVFIGVLEESGDIELLICFVFCCVLKQFGLLLREQWSFYVSVNVIGKDIVDFGFIDFVMCQMVRESVCLEQVVLELIECIIEVQGCLLVGMNCLCEFGLKIYVDDFGIGYLNLVYLVNLLVDVIKIDKVFIQFIGDSSVVELIFDKFCLMVEYLEIGVVVEGIEIQVQVDYVLCCLFEVFGQGWYFGKVLLLEVFFDYYWNQLVGCQNRFFVGYYVVLVLVVYIGCGLDGCILDCMEWLEMVVIIIGCYVCIFFYFG